jgi:hypothetical protein
MKIRELAEKIKLYNCESKEEFVENTKNYSICDRGRLLYSVTYLKWEQQEFTFSVESSKQTHPWDINVMPWNIYIANNIELSEKKINSIVDFLVDNNAIAPETANQLRVLN